MSIGKDHAISILIPFRSINKASLQVEQMLERFTFGKSTFTTSDRKSSMITTNGSIASRCTKNLITTCSSPLMEACFSRVLQMAPHLFGMSSSWTSKLETLVALEEIRTVKMHLIE